MLKKYIHVQSHGLKFTRAGVQRGRTEFLPSPSLRQVLPSVLSFSPAAPFIAANPRFSSPYIEKKSQ